MQPEPLYDIQDTTDLCCEFTSTSRAGYEDNRCAHALLSSLPTHALRVLETITHPSSEGGERVTEGEKRYFTSEMVRFVKAPILHLEAAAERWVKVLKVSLLWNRENAETEVLHAFKECSRCHDPKLLSEFPFESSNTDGHAAYCRTCKAIINREYRDKKKEAA